LKLDAFTVVRSQPVIDHVSAIGWHAHRPVVTWIPVSELETGIHRLSPDEAARHVFWNIELVERIATAKYERGDHVPYESVGRDARRVTVMWADIVKSGETWRAPPASSATWASRHGRFAPTRRL
jgi:hypothetical protein